ncbi:hypothetical protein JX265_008709 [Neoarthrinium moseri]|uniref:Ricin B lectin domain-containing protein n=1 Tax=Neoarthrinium moseri TaxID=1658444 RepID=A0A9Q0AJT0_9PEZI|nr:uncharacterized protein JN550_008814 [Neoarthrinium moseri]KAI1848510.1 hypothetical protein JX266_005816 [Neoarthrinium moseri]KAI1863492.1 hypothetical protein JX265_008709 [Neoarthrinium moseri]KAI1864527.1 hypothetical protein JN550_008814 [Neoarthrinium moseri]
MLAHYSPLFALLLARASAAPLDVTRAVAQLDQALFEEAQQRDDTATRAFTNVPIKTSDGRCLFIDELSGDFRANLTPIQVTDCAAVDGQRWDVITRGKHNNAENSMLIVSTLTGACFNFDPRRAAGNQVVLFSCGGRADGGGEVTNSQLFPYHGDSGPMTFSPENQSDSCFTVEGNVLAIAPCSPDDPSQTFTFGGAVTEGDTEEPDLTTASLSTASTMKATEASTMMTATTSSTRSATGIAAGGIPRPTAAVPVSRAGEILQPSAAAEAHQRDNTATRAFSSASILAPNGKCLFVDPTAGDFRENLIPVSLVACGGTPNEKFDIITAGKHNNAQGKILIVSSLVGDPIVICDVVNSS